MKDTYCAYYTHSPAICEALQSLLRLEDGDIVLDPSAGDGALADTVLSSGKKVSIDLLEINADAAAALSVKYGDRVDLRFQKRRHLVAAKSRPRDRSHVVLKETDTLTDEDLDRFASAGGHYTKIIANPPYGAWQDFERREGLKARFPGHYVRETYSLFFLRALSLLKPDGRLAIIIPDTWLYLKLHTALRQALFREAEIEDILVFPSTFFPGLTFGYSSLSIVSLRKKKTAVDHRFRIVKGFRHVSELALVCEGTVPSHCEVYSLSENSLLATDSARAILADEKTEALLKSPELTLGDVADVVTGLCTGENRRFLRAANDRVPGSRGYLTLERALLRSQSDLTGIDEPEAWIPYVKSAPKRPYAVSPDNWFLRWDRATVDFYKTDKKARFQNARFYFRPGLGIPMVKSKKIRAFLLEDRVFDQSIVGIFPKNASKRLYILALMNAEVVNDLIRRINPTANNSANYVKTLPYREPPEAERLAIESKVRALLDAEAAGETERADAIHAEIDERVAAIYR